MTAVVAGVLGLLAALPLSASANLPDSRIYEQVSPPNKNGNTVCGICFELAAANGNGVAFYGLGGMGVTAQSNIEEFIALRKPGLGWSTHGIATRSLASRQSIFSVPPYVVPSADFSSDVFMGNAPYSEEQLSGPYANTGVNIFINNGNPLTAPIWVGKPTTTKVRNENGSIVAGTTPNLSAVYFAAASTFTPQDESRAPGAWGFYEWKPEDEGGLVTAGELPNKTFNKWGAVPAALAGFEDGSRYPGYFRGSSFDNQVSENGLNAFFVSPDPDVVQTESEPPVPVQHPEPPELYVRETSATGEHHAVLVSRSELPGVEGEPAPSGVTRMQHGSDESASASYVYASSDGSQAFFASPDRLTADAPSGSTYTASVPLGTSTGTFTLSTQIGEEPKQTTAALPFDATATEVQAALGALSNVGAGNVTVTGPVGDYTIGFNLQIALTGTGAASVLEDPFKGYDFDVETEELTYVPGLDAPDSNSCSFPACSASGIVALARDGSDLMFYNQATSPRELDIWTRGPNGGSIQRLTSFPEASIYQHILYGTRASTNGSVFVFATSAKVEPLAPGAEPFNTGGVGQIYRYEVAQGEKPAELSCVSCPPAGINPTGPAEISHDNRYNANAEQSSIYDTRVISADGTRVFFDTPDPLVAADTNGVRDVYEWENGSIYLISEGTGIEDTNYLDSSESGGDVFFVTKDGIAPGDTDGGEDVYDARVPQPGDNPPPKAVPCEGDVCQGPPSVPQLLSPAASAEFNGLGNIPPEEIKEELGAKPATKTTACKKGFVKKGGKCVKKKAKKKVKKSKNAARKGKSNRGAK